MVVTDLITLKHINRITFLFFRQFSQRSHGSIRFLTLTHSVVEGERELQGFYGKSVLYESSYSFVSPEFSVRIFVFIKFSVFFSLSFPYHMFNPKLLTALMYPVALIDKT